MSSLLNSEWWLPRGWATYLFIMLAGYTCAVVMPWATKFRESTVKLRHRAWLLLAVMVGSNLVFQTAKVVVEAKDFMLADASWWLALLTFKNYGLSVVLLPTAILLLTLPAVYRCQSRIGLLNGFGAVIAPTIVLLATPYVTVTSLALSVLGASSVIGLGMIGFLLGLCYRPQTDHSLPRYASLLVGIVFVCGAGMAVDQIPHGLAYGAVVASIQVTRLLLVLQVATLAGQVLARLGESALLVFISHRFVMQTVVLVSGWLTSEPYGGAFYALYFGATASLCYGVARHHAQLVRWIEFANPIVVLASLKQPMVSWVVDTARRLSVAPSAQPHTPALGTMSTRQPLEADGQAA